MDINRVAYLQGISDWLRYRNRVPVYWKGTPEGEAWKDGYHYAAGYNKS